MKHRFRTTSRVMVSLYAITLFLFGLVVAPEAQANFIGYSEGDNTQSNRGVIRGKVTDRDTGEPVSYTSIVIVETNRAATAHDDGMFVLPNVASGVYTLRTHRVGYESTSQSVTVTANDTITVNFSIRSSIFRSRAIQVTADRDNENIIRAEHRVSGRELRQQLGRTLAETLQNEPGMAQSTMGPAPARPVLRGLSGDRLVLLEDGRTTGDVSTSAPDHAVTIDPINSQYIEILRGPSALIYTSNAVAGVVNVVRGQIPTELPEHFHGTASVQGETVNQGLAAGGAVYSSRDNLALKADLGLRTSADITTPEGTLNNTSIRNLHGGVGLSRIDDRGLLGFSANMYLSSYGIPDDFIGSHPEGVNINLQRYQFDTRYERYPDSDWIKRAQFNYTFSFYFHEELEYSPPRDRLDIVGYQSNLVTNTVTGRYYHGKMGFVDQGIFGFYGQHSYNSPGGFTFTPSTNDLALATFAYQDFGIGNWAFQTGLRFDLYALFPVEETDTAFGLRTNRTFFNVSGGTKASYSLTRNLVTSFSLMRTIRIPGVEELFSEGPHLPAYSYEVGDPTLKAEIGHGAEWTLRYASESFGIQNSWYFYSFSNYLYPRNTGEESVRRPLPIYQFTGASARIYGTEILAEWQFLNGFMLNGTASYVLGDLTADNEPLPFIPPLTGKIDLQYAYRVFTIGSSIRFASDQDRLGEFEEPTDGYQVYDAFVQAHFSHGSHMHTFSLTLENITNETYRMHLSRVKSIMPEPGRNVKLLYRMYF